MKYCYPWERPGKLAGKSSFSEEFFEHGGILAKVLAGSMIAAGDVITRTTYRRTKETTRKGGFLTDECRIPHGIIYNMTEVATFITTFGFPVGFGSVASTVGIMVGAGIFIITSNRRRFVRWFVALALLMVGFALIFFTDPELVSQDAPIILFDELAVIPLMFVGYRLIFGVRDLLFVPFALLLFGLLDAYKPGGLEVGEMIPGALGVLADDILVAVIGGIFLWFAYMIFINIRRENIFY